MSARGDVISLETCSDHIHSFSSLLYKLIFEGDPVNPKLNMRLGGLIILTRWSVFLIFTFGKLALHRHSHPTPSRPFPRLLGFIWRSKGSCIVNSADISSKDDGQSFHAKCTSAMLF